MQVVIWLYFMVEDAHLIPATPDDWPLILHPGVFLGQVLPAAVGLGIVFLFGRGAAKAIGVRLGRFRYGLVYGIVAFAAVTPACLVVNWISNYIAIMLGVSPKLHPLLEVAEKAEGPWILPLALLLAGVLAPLVEEFLFRGVLLMSLIRPMGAAGAIGVTSVIFALLHYTNEPQAVPPLLLLGVVLGYLAYRTRSLVAPIMTHALFNTVMIMQAFGGG
jgi:membrane protease YdiL (CAAX protease family)